AFNETGKEVRAEWSNGNVGMTGTSYDGTLPIMVATTGVEGLKAIVPIAAISNWYSYYRANGLVVSPGGYIGEDADVLGYFIYKKGTCKKEMENITKSMGRENGDFTPFWQSRNYLPLVKNVKAATFIIHGQSDWNVKQTNAIELWEALEGVAPRRMFLHRGGHGSTSSYDVPQKIEAWFDHFLEGDQNGITNGLQVEVQMPDGTLMAQESWPNERTVENRLFFSSQGALTEEFRDQATYRVTDMGSSQSIETLAENPSKTNEGRLLFSTSPFLKPTILSGTSRVSLNLAVGNRRAANITVALVEYDKEGRSKIITRGWADPQNYNDLAHGELLVPGKSYQLSFNLEPKQFRLAAGSKLGVLITSTDKEYTLRPKIGTIINFSMDEKSFIEVRLSN
ncbi:MAG: hypothetical protein K2Q18_10260, partial [Bdellovibrionales bacterium]|nr:hypothetical protein [Bdellovibrionales bacterium]